MNLYFDKYDYSTGTFTEMTDGTSKQYLRDLKTFYKAFTGNEMPVEIKQFSDIKLRDYNAEKFCQGTEAPFKRSHSINKKDELFVKYAENIQRMINSAASNQSKLLSVINDLFTYVVDPYTKKKKIRINPKLNDELLQSAVEKARKLIIDLYVKCEKDYVEGVKLYEAIVESTILETTKNQIGNLKTETKQMEDETTKVKVNKKQLNNKNNNNYNNNNYNNNNYNNNDRDLTNMNNKYNPAIPISSPTLSSDYSYPTDLTDSAYSLHQQIQPEPQPQLRPQQLQPLPIVNNI